MNENNDNDVEKPTIDLDVSGFFGSPESEDDTDTDTDDADDGAWFGTREYDHIDELMLGVGSSPKASEYNKYRHRFVPLERLQPTGWGFNGPDDDEPVGQVRIEQSDIIPEPAREDYERVKEKYNSDDYSDAQARSESVEWIRDYFYIVRNTDRSDGDTTTLWRYDDDESRWVADGNRYLKDILSDIDPNLQGPELDRIIDLYGSRYTMSEDDFDAGDLLIPVDNGMLDLREAKLSADGKLIPESVVLRDHDPSWGNTYTLDATWAPDEAALDDLDAWLNRSVRTDEERSLTYQWAGHAISSTYVADGMLVITGEGGAGKSVFLNALREMIGDENTSEKSLDAIEEAKFRLDKMMDSVVNIDDDLQGTSLSTVGKIKKLTTGATMSVSRMYQPDVSMANSASMIFAANSPPAIPERNRAMGRRLYSVEFVSEYVEDPDPDNPYQHELLPKANVQQKYHSQEMLSALLYRAVEGLLKVLENGDFVTEDSWEDRLEKYESQSDPIMSFARECLKEDPGGEVCIDDIKLAYDAYAETYNHPGKSKQVIGSMLGNNPRLKFTKGQTRSWSDKATQHTVYRGISFTAGGFELLPDAAPWENYMDQLPDGFDSDADEETPDTRSDIAQVSERVIERCSSIDPALKRGNVVARTAVHYDTDPDTVGEAFDRLVEKGDLIEVSTTDDAEPIYEVNR